MSSVSRNRAASTTMATPGLPEHAMLNTVRFKLWSYNGATCETTDEKYSLHHRQRQTIKTLYHSLVLAIRWPTNRDGYIRVKHKLSYHTQKSDTVSHYTSFTV